MESNTETIEETKAMVQSLAQRQREGEKRLVEEKKHLNKCKQVFVRFAVPIFIHSLKKH